MRWSAAFALSTMWVRGGTGSVSDGFDVWVHMKFKLNDSSTYLAQWSFVDIA